MFGIVSEFDSEPDFEQTIPTRKGSKEKDFRVLITNDNGLSGSRGITTPLTGLQIKLAAIWQIVEYNRYPMISDDIVATLEVPPTFVVPHEPQRSPHASHTYT